MVSISSTTSSVIFTFTDNPYYLQNGTIEVPKGSLTLVIDSSNMATFKKAASNDVFLSISLTELEMTKQELETYFVSNMVQPSGGGGSGTTYTAGQGISISNDVISVTADTALNSGSSNVVANSAVTNAINAKQDTLTAGEGIQISGSTISVTGGGGDVSNYFDGALYEMSGETHVINFYHGDVVKATIDADDFIKDGMVDDVEISNGYLVITFNTDSGKQPISIQLTDIFDPSNYYTTGQTDSAITAAVSGKADTSTVETLSGQVTANTASISNKADTSALTAHTSDTTIHVTSADKTAWNAKVDASDLAGYTTTGTTDALNTVVTAHTADTEIHVTTAQTAAWDAKQTALTAGTGIDITDNVISVTGGSSVTVDPTLDSGSTNPVANSAITAAINAKPNLVNLTQSEYDELQTKDSNTIYNITDAAVFDPSDYWTSGQTQSAITSATSGLQTTLTASTGISIVSNVISVSADTALNSGSTNVVTNAAVTTAINAINSNMGGLKLVKISQADYDLLPTKDNDTLYVIV